MKIRLFDVPRARHCGSRAGWLSGVAFGALALWLGNPANANAATFFAGDLIVSVEGNGSNTASGGTAATGNTGGSANTYLDNQAAPLTLYEFHTTGTLQSPVSTLALPQAQGAGGAGNAPVSGEYGSSSEAQLHLSGNGQFLTIAGYAVNAQSYNSTSDVNGTGTALAQSCSLSAGCGSTPQVSRVIATVSASGQVNSTTVLNDVFNGNNPRSVYSSDGKSFYISGQGTGNPGDKTGGVFFVPQLGPNQTAQPITGTDATSSGNPPNDIGQDTRDVQIVHNTLFVSTDTKQGSNSARDFIGTLGAAGTPPTTVANGSNGPDQLTGFGATSAAGKDTGKVTITTGATTNGNQFNNSTASSHNLINLSPAGFFFASASILYVADTGSPKNDSNGDELDPGQQRHQYR